jgi:hypothetical protein
MIEPGFPPYQEGAQGGELHMLKQMAVGLAVTLCLVGRAVPQSPEAAPAEAASPTLTNQPPPLHDSPVLAGDCGSVADSASPRWWISTDYLVGWTRSNALPPLVTTSPAGTAQTAAGVLGQPGTSILFGNTNEGGDTRSGIHLGLGGWIDSRHTFGIDAGASVLESQNTLFFANSPTGTPILARPFTDATTGTPSSQLVAFPGLAGGSIAGSLRSGNLYDVYVDAFSVILDKNGFKVEPLLGYRLLGFSDRLAMDTNMTATGGTVATGTQIVTSDHFSATNVFNGGVFGVKAVYGSDRLFAGLALKLAVGQLRRSIGILGTTTVTTPGFAPLTETGGFLALGSNSGVFHLSEWEVVPEVGLNFGWAITENLCLRCGYDFLLYPNVARAANLVDLNINPGLLPPAQAGATPSNPAFQLKKTDMWVQTLNLGLEFKF